MAVRKHKRKQKKKRMKGKKNILAAEKIKIIKSK